MLPRNPQLSSLFGHFLSGVYCCGPVPLRAIKEGELTLKYDASFVFAEVNADIITYMKKKDGSTSEVIYPAVVGQKISTKSVGSDAREDITHLYKYPEGREHRATVYIEKPKLTFPKCLANVCRLQICRSQDVYIPAFLISLSVAVHKDKL